jgi:nitroreductase
MNVYSAMKNRQSARAYLPKPVARADIEDILKYAGMAPSAINCFKTERESLNAFRFWYE